MSWLSDALYTVRDYHPINPNGAIWRGLMEMTGNDPKEVEDRAKLRSAQIDSIGSGIPILGNFFRGMEGVERLEDYYRNTGFLPEYPFGSNFGAGALGTAGGSLGRTLGGRSGKEGIKSLSKYYEVN